MTIEFFITSMVVILLPGTGVLYTIAVGLGRGFRPSVMAAFGCTLGILPSALASIIGLAAIFHTSALAFQIVKYAGVAYLSTWPGRCCAKVVRSRSQKGDSTTARCGSSEMAFF